MNIHRATIVTVLLLMLTLTACLPTISLAKASSYSDQSPTFAQTYAEGMRQAVERVQETASTMSGATIGGTTIGFDHSSTIAERYAKGMQEASERIQ